MDDVPTNPVIYVRIPGDLHDRMKLEATNWETSLTKLVTRAVEFYLSEKFDYDAPGRKGLP